MWPASFASMRNPHHTPLGVIGSAHSQRLEFLRHIVSSSGSVDLFLMCMEEGQGAVRSMSEVDGLGLGLRHVSSMSTTLWFVEEGEGAGNWEGGARGCCSSSSTCSSMRVGGGGALFLVLLFKGGGGRG